MRPKRIIRKPEPLELPASVVERVNRVHAFHDATKLSAQAVSDATGRLDPDSRPSPYRTFPDLPRTSLPTSLLDIPASTLSLLASGADPMREDVPQPPHDLKTLATLLHMAGGLTRKADSEFLRSCPSAGGLYPCEIYIAAFAIEGLESGLYHFCPRQFILSRLRDGPETLGRLKRGRPDLEFLKTVPAVLLVSTIYWRSAWKYGLRAYRYCLLDAGHLVQNLALCAAGLDMGTITRLRVPDAACRELIGVPADAPFDSAENVQAMIVWADASEHSFAAPAAGGPLPAIARPPLSARFTNHADIVTAHHDCVAPGVVMAEVRPPLTELTPLPEDFPTGQIEPQPVDVGKPLRQALLDRRSVREFAQRSLARDALAHVSRLSFRSGTFFPIKPDGPHVGLVRPLWLVNDVAGMDRGIWYYHPPTDRWSLIGAGDFRRDGRFVCLDQDHCGDAGAICFLAVNLHALMTRGGPDTYRLAHLEAGVAGQRFYLAAEALGLGCCAVGAFYDEEVRKLLTMEGSGWEVLYAMALGARRDER
jgi:SagB-type dehydrogenase family enzyme